MSRIDKLRELADRCRWVYDERTAKVLAGGEDCPRYALLASEGKPESTFRDNPDLTVHDTPEAMREAIAIGRGEGWGVLAMVDLETGDELPPPS